MILDLEPARLIAFLAASCLLVAIPGPNHIYILTRSVGQGRRAGFVSALGVETGTLVHAAAAAFGLSALIAASAPAFTVVRLGGAAYLVYLGVRALRGAGETDLSAPRTAQPLGAVFREGIAVNLLNPKVALFFLAFLPQFVTPGAGADTARLQLIALGAALATIGLASDVWYALAGGWIGRWLRGGAGRMRWQRRVVATAYLALAGYAVTA